MLKVEPHGLLARTTPVQFNKNVNEWNSEQLAPCFGKHVASAMDGKSILAFSGSPGLLSQKQNEVFGPTGSAWARAPR